MEGNTTGMMSFAAILSFTFVKTLTKTPAKDVRDKHHLVYFLNKKFV
jgi:hypothetical protein